ncbi:MAG TPA: formate dehydrogenase accessory sulfurtransferase FdhD [Xanthobacteraceae bacterium]|nr:formate dehydrogenase accessory sulfurtransferase FdhD [Xanthobacteraceae bacterium]
MSLCATSTLRDTYALAAPARVGQPAACAPAPVAEEVPVGFVYNGFPHAVMMATPDDLEDFAVGFSLTEGIIETTSGVRDLAARPRADGIELAIELAPPALNAFLRRRRVRALRGHTSCGICGVEEIAQVAQASAPMSSPRPCGPALDGDAIRRAMAALRDYQPLSRMTHCAHAAAWADAAGRLVLAREDVGRHNALDKLIGASLRHDVDRSAGFCLVTSRCSFEMVQKAIAARIAVLVAISAPTALAIRTAGGAGLLLVVPDRDGELAVYSAPD